MVLDIYVKIVVFVKFYESFEGFIIYGRVM